MNKIALLAGYLLFLACSSDGQSPGAGQGGHGGGQRGGTGGSDRGGTTGRAGNSGGGGGQAGGSTGAAGSSDGGGQGGSSAGGRGGRGGTAGSAGSGARAGAAGLGGGGGGGQAGGKAGQGGAGGGGKGGQGGAGGNGPSCAEIQTAYAKELLNARMCNLAVSAPSCTHLVPSALSCGCSVWVNDATELDRIAAQWQAAGCTPGIVCAAIACLSPGTHGVCVPIDSGDFCMGTSGPT
jgi:hypothetical protein